MYPAATRPTSAPDDAWLTTSTALPSRPARVVPKIFEILDSASLARGCLAKAREVRWVATSRCPHCGLPVRIEVNEAFASMVLEPTVDLDDPFAEVVWVSHSEDRCEFAAIVAEYFT
jgi:hypothetical protein